MGKPSCDVSLNTVACEHPGSVDPEESPGFPGIRTKCFACGMHACKTCSKVQPWHGYGRRRICNDCIGEYQ